MNTSSIIVKKMYRRLPVALFALCLFVYLPSHGQVKGYSKSVQQKRKSMRKYMGFKFFSFKQLESFEPYHYFGGGVNALNYFGDLAPVNSAASTDFSFTRPGVGIFYGYKFHQSLAVRFNYNFGILRGDDSAANPNDSQSSYSRYQRNLSFRNLLHETSLNLEISVLPESWGMKNRALITAHVILGVALFHHNPQGKVPANDYQMSENAPLPAGLEPGKWVNLHPLDTEGSNMIHDEEGNAIVRKNGGSAYSRLQFALPVGLGAVAHITKNLSLGMEFSVRFTFTDYLDDVSTEYVDLAAFEDPVARIFSDRSVEPMAVVKGESRNPDLVKEVSWGNGEQYRINGVVGSGVTGSIRGNPDVNDHYFLTQIKVFYSLSRQ